jgi:hypothetical protein
MVTNSKKWFWRRGSENTPSDAQKERKDSLRGSENAPSEGVKTLPPIRKDSTVDSRDTYIPPEPRTGSVSLSSTLRKSKTIETPLPANFRISDNVRKWASEKGHTRLEEHLEYFIGYAKANGAKYADWDHALQNAIRSNWAKLNSNVKPIPGGGGGYAGAPLPRFAPAEPMPTPNPDVVRLTAYKSGGVAR